MLQKHAQITVEKATVKFVKEEEGMGVLINGNLILTAAHCIDCNCEGDMAVGRDFIEDIESANGEKLRISPIVVEPVIDIAILGSLDNQVFFEEADRFEMFCENTKPVILSRDEFELGYSFPVYLLTHKRKWLIGKAMKHQRNSPLILIEFNEKIESGTSGGPVINEAGELIGILSQTSESSNEPNKCTAIAPLPHLALPVWVCQRYFDPVSPYYKSSYDL